MSEQEKPVVLYTGINADRTCITVGTTEGFGIIYSGLGKPRVIKHDFGRGIGIAELLGTSNIVALVGGSMFPEFPPDQVVFWNLKEQSKVGGVKLSRPVLSLKVTREWVVVGTEEGIYVSRTDCLQAVRKISLEPPSEGEAPWPATHVSVACASPLFVAEGGMGMVLVSKGAKGIEEKKEKEKEKKERELCLGVRKMKHTKRVVCSTVSPDGRYYATASGGGTKIRVFDFANGVEKACLARGSKEAAIRSLAFSPDGSLLAISSDSETIHVYSSGVGGCQKYSKVLGGYIGYCNTKDCGKNAWVHFVGGKEEREEKEERYTLLAVEVSGKYRAYDVVVEDKKWISIKKRESYEGDIFSEKEEGKGK